MGAEAVRFVEVANGNGALPLPPSTGPTAVT